MNVTGPVAGEAGTACVSHTILLLPSLARAISAVRAAAIGDVYDIVSPDTVLAYPDMSDLPSDCCVDNPSCAKGMNRVMVSATLKQRRRALMDNLV